MTASTHSLTALPLAEIALRHAGASRVLQRYHLDFCCRGRRTLAEACAEDGLDPVAVGVDLIAAEEAGTDTGPDWDERPLPELVEHLLEAFHEDHRAEVPQLVEMAAKVEHVHAEKPTCPRGLTAHLARMAGELEDHMQKEEQVLFPLILAGRGPEAGMPVQVMEHEHQDHARNLERLRELAHGFEPPAEACTTWRALYQRLELLERRLMEHISLENHVLFPRALRG